MVDEVVQHARADDEVEVAIERGGALDRQLPNVEIRQVVLTLDCSV